MRSSLLIEAEELQSRLGESNLIILEAGFAMPGDADPRLIFFQTLTIPSAQYFNIDQISDPDNPLPHMLPSAETFQQAVQRMGVNNTSEIVVYDRMGLFSACRVWWTFKIFGHDNIRVLNGGLKNWQLSAYPTARPKDDHSDTGNFIAKYNPDMYANKTLVQQSLNKGTIVDARPASRFCGEAAEPRVGMRSGHMPNAYNIPFISLSDPETGKLRDHQELQSFFKHVPDENRIYTCGSGITACCLMFAAHIIGQEGGRIYDGSWVEWGSCSDTEIVTGA